MTRERMRQRIVALLGGTMYALFVSFGFQAERFAESRPLWGLLAAGALCLPVTFLLEKLFRCRCLSGQETERAFRAGRAFWMITACYVPMLLVSFPGAFAYDVPFQLEQVFSGQYSTHHPLLHTLLMGGCVKLGYALGSINLGAALYSVVQLAGLAGCFALACGSIARQCGARAARRSAVFFALYPLHMMMAVNATKDVLFSGLFVLTLALARELLVLGGSRKLRVELALCGASMMLLRNNALYAVVVWLFALLVLQRRRALALCGAAALAVCLCVAASNGMKAATGAVDGDLSEMLSWPIQQMARVRNLHEDRMTPNEIAAVDELMPRESWRLYDPTISDPVKFEFDTAALREDFGKYVRVYLSLGMKCPKAYFDALLMHTYSFWYPYSEYRVSGYYLQMGVTDQYYEWCDFERISSQSLLPRVLASLTWRFGAKGAMQIPLIGYLFNMGVIVWAMLFFVLRDAYHGRWECFVIGLLPVLLWGTFLLGPVMAGRYIYPFACCLPVLATRPKDC